MEAARERASLVGSEKQRGGGLVTRPILRREGNPGAKNSEENLKL